jgi:hypothetical protein
VILGQILRHRDHALRPAAGQPITECEFGVVREGEGSGYIKVFWPDGSDRVLFFEDGTPAALDRSEADGDRTMTVAREVDLCRVRIGHQRFEIPEAVLLGGFRSQEAAV